MPGLGAFDAPLVQGFAVTLAVGVLLSMFSAITVTRTLMKSLIGTRVARSPELLGVDAPPAAGAAAGAPGAAGT